MHWRFTPQGRQYGDYLRGGESANACHWSNVLWRFGRSHARKWLCRTIQRFFHCWLAALFETSLMKRSEEAISHAGFHGFPIFQGTGSASSASFISCGSVGFGWWRQSSSCSDLAVSITQRPEWWHAFIGHGSKPRDLRSDHKREKRHSKRNTPF